MYKNTNLLIFFLLFIIIFVSILYYPLFSVEYFNNNNNFNIKQFINLDKQTKKYIDKENNYNDYLENIEFSPNCCPSLITSSTGCACFNKSLTSLIYSRGNNKKC